MPFINQHSFTDYHLCICSFLCFSPSCHSVLLLALFLNLFQCDLFPSSFPSLFSFLIFLVMCLFTFYMLFQLLIHNSGFMLDPCVPSLFSVLSAPLQTFCCTRTPPSLICVSGLFHLLRSHISFSEQWSTCLFPCLAHMHTCLFYMRSCSHSVTLILATVSGEIAPADASLFLDCLPFCLKFLPVLLLPLPYARSPQTYKKKSLFLSRCLLSF